jgi:hypothetical protein
MISITTLSKVSSALLKQSKKPASITAVCIVIIMLGLSASARSQEIVIQESLIKQNVANCEVFNLTNRQFRVVALKLDSSWGYATLGSHISTNVGREIK